MHEHTGQTVGNREGRKGKKIKTKLGDKKAKSKRANKKKDTDTTGCPIKSVT